MNFDEKIKFKIFKMLQRLMEQRHLSERDSKLMIGAQMNMDQKASMAQFVIENSGSLQDTHEQVSTKRDLFSFFNCCFRCQEFMPI